MNHKKPWAQAPDEVGLQAMQMNYLEVTLCPSGLSHLNRPVFQ